MLKNSNLSILIIVLSIVHDEKDFICLNLYFLFSVHRRLNEYLIQNVYYF